MMRAPWLLAGSAILMTGGGASEQVAAAPDGGGTPAPAMLSPEGCRAIAGRMRGVQASGGIDTAEFRATAPAPPAGPMAPPLPAGLILPAHCDVHGTLDRRIAPDGQRYAIRYHLRLPARWNGRFFFQGGGGTNGLVGDALGQISPGRAPALTLGYAVVSQDSGHDNARNTDPARGGDAVFGGNPQARADYGGTSLPRVAGVAKAIIARAYGRAPRRSYFVGCSKGGQEGMAFAQRYPDQFDGIVAAAPGFSLPRAALAQAWSVQTFASLIRRPGTAPVAFGALPGVFAPAQLAHVRGAVLRACDRDDGLADGIVGRFGTCSAARVLPELSRGCIGGDCPSASQIAALARSLAGPRDATDQSLYVDWPWDGGIGSDGWRLWKLGSARMPALDILTGAPALAMIFSVPPSPLRADPQSLLDWQLAFDVVRDAHRIDAVGASFPRSAWTDISARSADLAAFRRRGGKLIVPHGASDPVFSINDTLAWYNQVQARNGGQADRFVRVFAVPGMNHCGGGPATDDYDAFATLVAWVEHGRVPDHIVARAGPASPWPGRTRPLCPAPRVAVYTGRGSIEDAANFACR